MSTAFQAGKVLYSQQSAMSQMIGVYTNGGAPALAAWLADPANMNEVANLSGALNLWAAEQPQAWPSPPGVPVLDAAQRDALFRAEWGIGPMSAFIDLMPGVPDTTINIYKQFYAFGNPGWAEVLDWHTHI